MAWSSPEPKTGKKRASKKRTRSAKLGLIALGTRSGEIVVWDLDRAKVVQRLGSAGDGHKRGVSGLVFNPSGSALFSCANDSAVLQWDVGTGEVQRSLDCDRHGVARLALSVAEEGHTLVTASASLQLWDMTSATVTQRLPGHATPVSALAMAQDGRYFLSAADDRGPCLWATAPPAATAPSSSRKKKKGRKSKKAAPPAMAAAVATLSVDTHPAQLCLAAGEGGQYTAAIVSDTGLVQVWQITPKTAALGPSSISPHCTLSLAGASKRGGGSGDVLCARLASASAPASSSAPALQLARGSLARPTFTTVSLTRSPTSDGDDSDSDGDDGMPSVADSTLLPHITLPALRTTALLSGSGEQSPTGVADGAASIAGAGQADPQVVSLTRSAAELPNPTALPSESKAGEEEEAGESAPKRRRTAAVDRSAEGDSSDGGSSSSNEEEEDGEESEGDQPLGERVQDALDTLEEEQAAETAAAVAAAAGATPASVALASQQQQLARASGGGVAPKADSLVSVLSQALASDDNALLEFCLSNTNPAIVAATVHRLQPARVLPLLHKIIDKFEDRPNRAAALSVWIRAVVERHTAYLMTQPRLADTLGPLHSTIEARVSVFDRMLRLSGRVDLVLAQATLAKERVAQTEALAAGGEEEEEGSEDGEDGAAAAAPKVYLESDTESEGAEDSSGSDEEEEEGEEEGGSDSDSSEEEEEEEEGSGSEDSEDSEEEESEEEGSGSSEASEDSDAESDSE